MLRLLLLRHAKSAWSDLDLPDIARPLNARGLRSTPLIGRYLEKQALYPDRVLCSVSRRTRETLAGLLPFLRNPCEITISEQIYRNSETSYLAPIRGLAGPAETLLLIGHNPATQDTALATIGSGDPVLRAAIGEKYPTGALAFIRFEATDWADIVPGSGHLEAFVLPRDLEESREPGAPGA